jgi:hypothetical protein
MCSSIKFVRCVRCNEKKKLFVFRLVRQIRTIRYQLYRTNSLFNLEMSNQVNGLLKIFNEFDFFTLKSFANSTKQNDHDNYPYFILFKFFI